eukprot:6317296-Lingulodinium_polyedra.AAC.1
MPGCRQYQWPDWLRLGIASQPRARYAAGAAGAAGAGEGGRRPGPRCYGPVCCSDGCPAAAFRPRARVVAKRAQRG